MREKTNEMPTCIYKHQLLVGSNLNVFYRTGLLNNRFNEES